MRRADPRARQVHLRTTARCGDEGASGTVTIMTFTDSRIAGTFAFTAVGEPATGATGTLSVTNGVFDVQY